MVLVLIMGLGRVGRAASRADPRFAPALPQGAQEWVLRHGGHRAHAGAAGAACEDTGSATGPETEVAVG